jgi:hypothetical protein
MVVQGPTVLPLGAVNLREVVEVYGHVGLGSRVLLSEHIHGLLDAVSRLGVLAVPAVDLPDVAEANGDAEVMSLR